ncbi:MAG TPA: lipocalin-like domain-containing protein [Longimicrobium sp.]|nr:lipocalin-like domain-containing protein [Longimicrobium sp.]
MSSEVGISPRTQLARLREAVTGVWKLVSAENFVDGAWVPAFGTPPSGYFIYDASGYASVQIMTVPPVTVTEPDSDPPSPDEALAIFNGYIAYYGTWTVDAQNLTVYVQGAWDPRQVCTAQARPYQVGGDILIIGDQTTYRRTLQRVG